MNDLERAYLIKARLVLFMFMGAFVAVLLLAASG